MTMAAIPPPEAVVNVFSDQLDIKLFTQANAGPASARNSGFSLAKGEFLAFIDDDCTPAPDWLQTLAVRFASKPEHAIGGRTVNALPDNTYSTASQMLTDYLYTYYNAYHPQGRFFTSNNLAMPVGQFNMMGGFDTTIPCARGERTAISVIAGCTMATRDDLRPRNSGLSCPFVDTAHFLATALQLWPRRFLLPSGAYPTRPRTH